MYGNGWSVASRVERAACDCKVGLLGEAWRKWAVAGFGLGASTPRPSPHPISSLFPHYFLPSAINSPET